MFDKKEIKTVDNTPQNWSQGISKDINKQTRSSIAKSGHTPWFKLNPNVDNEFILLGEKPVIVPNTQFGGLNAEWLVKDENDIECKLTTTYQDSDGNYTPQFQEIFAVFKEGRDTQVKMWKDNIEKDGRTWQKWRAVYK